MTRGWVLMRIVLLKVSSRWTFDFYTRIPYIPKLISSVKWNQGCSRAGSFVSRPQRRLIRSHTWLVYGKRLESDLCCLQFPRTESDIQQTDMTWAVIWGRWKAEGLNWRIPTRPPPKKFLNSFTFVQLFAPWCISPPPTSPLHPFHSSGDDAGVAGAERGEAGDQHAQAGSHSWIIQLAYLHVLYLHWSCSRLSHCC